MDSIRIDSLLTQETKDSLQSISKTMEQYQMMSKSISDSLKVVTENYAMLTKSFSGVNEIVASARNALDACTGLDMSFLKSEWPSDSVLSSLRQFQDSLQIYSQSDISESLRHTQELLNIFSNNFMTEQNCSEIIAGVVSQISSTREILDAAYPANYDDSTSYSSGEEKLSEEEIQESLQEQINDPEKFQERDKKWSENQRKQYYAILRIVISILFQIFILPYLQEKVGLPVMTYVESSVKELPQKSANVVCKIKEGIEAIIVEDTNYYYKVRFIDENGEEQEGYVAKRNLKIIQENSSEENEIEKEDEEK